MTKIIGEVYKAVGIVGVLSLGSIALIVLSALLLMFKYLITGSTL